MRQDLDGPYLRSGHPTPDLRARAQAKIAEVEARIAGLTTIRQALTAVVNAGCDSLTDCTCPDCPLPFAGLAAQRGAKPYSNASTTSSAEGGGFSSSPR